MSRGVRTESVDGQSGFTLTRVKQGCHKNLAFRVVGLLVEFHSLPRLLKIIMCVPNFRLFSSSGLALVFPICDTHVTQFLHVPDRPCLFQENIKKLLRKFEYSKSPKAQKLSVLGPDLSFL